MSDFLNNHDFIKIYIGQLPLDFEQAQLTQILEPMAQLREVKIIKGDNSRGRFDLFCYAFVTMKGNQSFALDIIQKLHQMYPTWKMNVKYDIDRQRMQRPRPYQMQPPYQPYPYQQPNFQPYPNNRGYQQVQNQAMHPEVIIGNKPCNILVRQLWLGGIPENCDKGLLAQVLSYYGIIEEIQIFPKFAFVKFKQVFEATIAFERADEIVQRLGNPYGFRIFFSDPARRAYIVSNNYEYDKHSPSLPILFIGFPPITSATVDMQVIKPVVETYGQIKNQYMRRNTNGQNRSYFLFSFENVRTALRAKQELSRRKDLLGDKRAQLALLMDEEVVLRGHDLSHTEKVYQGEAKRGYFPQNKTMPMQYPQQMGYNQQQIPYNPYMQNYYPQPHNQYFYGQQNYYKQEEQNPPPFPEEAEQNEDQHNIHDFLKNVLSEKETGNQKKPLKSGEVGKEQDIISELLGTEAKIDTKEDKEPPRKSRGDEKEPSWSGFLTWKGLKRVGVDGFSTNTELEDYAINIMSLIEVKDLVLKEKSTMVLQPSNNIALKVFREYITQLGTRVGVAMNSKYLMYVMPKCAETDELQQISNDELLVVLEKASFLTLIKDKLVKCEENP